MFAGTGEYLVTMTVGGQTFKQVLKVERVTGVDDPATRLGEPRSSRKEEN